MAEKQPRDGIVLTEAQKRSRRQRSIAMALALGVLVVLFFAVTMVKGPAVLNRPPMGENAPGVLNGNGSQVWVRASRPASSPGRYPVTAPPTLSS